MMKLNVSFYRNKNGYIYCQIFFGGSKDVFSTKIKVKANQWSKGKPKGENAQQIKNKLNAISASLLECYEYLLAKSKFEEIYLTPQLLKDFYLNRNVIAVPKAQKSVIEILQELTEVKFNEKSITPRTKKYAKTKINNLKRFFESIEKPQITYDEITYQLLEEAISFLRVTNFSNKREQAPKKNTYLKKYIQFLREGNEYALQKGYCKKVIPKYRKLKDDTSETPYLLKHELNELLNLNLSKHTDKELEKVKDVFIFMCYTGFLWSDCEAFDPNEHLITENGKEIIVKPREKTQTLQKIPLFREAKAILEKYHYKLPLGVEQVYNRKIKEILQMIGLLNASALTLRSGRKTAGMIWLNAGIPIEIVSKMLGHKNIAITQKHYAKILNETILQATEHLLNPQISEQKLSKERMKAKLKQILYEILEE